MLWEGLLTTLLYRAAYSCAYLAVFYFDVQVLNPSGSGHVFNAMFVVLSCHSIEVQGSFPRFENLAFRGHVLRHRDILLARAVAVSPWLGGPGCALPCFRFIGFRCFFV